MKKNPYWTLCLAGVLILSLSACGGNHSEQDSAAERDTAQEGTTQENSENVQTTQDKTEIVRVSEREDYVGLQDLDIDAYVTLPDYRNMTVRVSRPQASDEEIEQYINSKLLRVNREVRDGDIVDIDYVGRKDGVAFQGGTASGYQLEIGSGSFIEGFEEGLIGVMSGDTVDLNLTFPEGYRNNPDLSGAPVVFTVTVNGILTDMEYAEMSQEEFESLHLPYQSKEELWEAGKAVLDEEAESVFQTNINTAIINTLKEDSAITSVPDWLVEEEIQNYNIYMDSVCQSYDVDLETFVTSVYQMTMEEYNARIAEMSEDMVRQYLAIEAVARAEGIEITDEQLNELADEEAMEYNSALPAGQEDSRYTSGQELLEEVGYTTYRKYILQDRVVERLNELVTIEEAEDLQE